MNSSSEIFSRPTNIRLGHHSEISNLIYPSELIYTMLGEINKGGIPIEFKRNSDTTPEQLDQVSTDHIIGECVGGHMRDLMDRPGTLKIDHRLWVDYTLKPSSVFEEVKALDPSLPMNFKARIRSGEDNIIWLKDFKIISFILYL